MPSTVQSNCDAHDTIANGQYGAVWSMGHTQQVSVRIVLLPSNVWQQFFGRSAFLRQQETDLPPSELWCTCSFLLIGRYICLLQASAPGPRYHQENTIEQHRYGGAGWLVWGGIILGSKTDLHVQSVTMTGHIYWDVILEQHVRLFQGAMGAEFLFMDDNARPHRANIVDECLQSEDITRMDWPAYSPDLIQ
ncbi:transposable element Tcb1 transposase [Trichonephila clavipes]|nr:transposable element Tcb1 transposase [Trichonephila clavipes]